MAEAKFRSRARVIDLLGRQQIADAPTAVGELFKNALDAGARRVCVDFWQDNGILILRDDGLGMRLEDVLGKWLVLATESRHGIRRLNDEWSKFADQEQTIWLNHPSYGEKGIGRLSVATLGRMTLLWTVWGKGSAKRGTLCLVHWHLFQHPTMLFEDLPVPYSEHTTSPSSQDVAELFQQLKKNKRVKSMLTDPSWDSNIQEELKADLEIPLKEVLSPFKFEWNMGTTFCILGPSDQVDELFLKSRAEIDPSADFPPDWIKAYHAFSTFWDPFHKPKGRNFNIEARLNGKAMRRTNRYWEPEDFSNCDHHIRVEVSEQGFAKGYVKNYGKPKEIYEKQLKHLPSGHSTPGAFVIEIGYVQGEKEDSPLPDDIHSEITKRLLHAGGFSIYLNNVRVQPYGGIDSDFAGFEERRLKNAGRYYFSTRRMFGGVFIPSKEKTNLVEKAGREGFVVNGARRGLRLWVEDLFVDLADTFFGRKAKREDKEERRRRKESEAVRERLEKEKAEYLASVRIHRGWLRDFEQRVKIQVQAVRAIFATESNSVPGSQLETCEKELETLKNLAEELRSTPADPPAGVTLEGDIHSVIDDYLAKREVSIRNLNREVATQTQALHSFIGRAKGAREQDRKITARIAEADNAIRNSITVLLRPALEKAATLEADLNELAEEEIRKVIRVRSSIMGDATPKQIVQDKTGELARQLEGAIQSQQEELERVAGPRLRRLVSDLQHLTENSSNALLLSEQAEEIQTLKERLSFLVEMAQLGIVLETATHEHEQQVSGIRDSIERLMRTADPEAKNLLRHIHDSFSIIDERLRLFDPLIRRRSATEKLITGEEIEIFLSRRFSNECGVNGYVTFTSGFRAFQLKEIKRPVLLGAIHNVFHNALYWAKKGTTTPKILFSSTGGSIVISDSGPGVNKRDIDRIFEPGFTRRPYGRGFGLYIAREALRGIGLELTCPSQPELGALDGANFVISLKNDDSKFNN